MLNKVFAGAVIFVAGIGIMGLLKIVGPLIWLAFIGLVVCLAIDCIGE